MYLHLTALERLPLYIPFIFHRLPYRSLCITPFIFHYLLYLAPLIFPVYSTTSLTVWLSGSKQQMEAYQLQDWPQAGRGRAHIVERAELRSCIASVPLGPHNPWGFPSPVTCHSRIRLSASSWSFPSPVPCHSWIRLSARGGSQSLRYGQARGR